MGRDKASLPYRGTTLASAVAQAVRDATGSVTLVGTSEPGSIPDLFPGEGPLGGIVTALRHSAAEWNLIVACDMPEIAAPFLCRLLDAAEASGSDVLLPVRPDGTPEPLCAVYRSRASEAIERRFADGVRKITAALGELAVCRLEIAEVLQFQNVNTPEDWLPYAAG
jgi:molybdopterin-guanine dinucleotide biosynthesis protein A